MFNMIIISNMLTFLSFSEFKTVTPLIIVHMKGIFSAPGLTMVYFCNSYPIFLKEYLVGIVSVEQLFLDYEICPGSIQLISEQSCILEMSVIMNVYQESSHKGSLSSK